MGVASNLPTLEELLESSASDRRHVVELRPGVLMTDWFLDAGTTYVAAFAPVFGGRRLDVVDVVTLLDTGLERAETLADCEATAGTFYFDPDVDTTDAFIWDESSWDDGKFWDRFPRLYVHLENGSNPRDTTVLARVVFFFAGQGAVVPDLGADMLEDGDFEAAWSGGAPAGWTKTEAGSGAVTEETADPIEGSKSVGLSIESDESGAASVQKTLALQVGAQYRVTAKYRTAAANRTGTGLLDGASFAARYDFEADGSGIGPALTEANSPTYGAAVHGNGAQLTKVTDLTDSPYFQSTSADFDPGSESSVLACKVRRDSSGNVQHIFSKGAGGGTGWSCRVALDRLVLSIKDAVLSTIQVFTPVGNMPDDDLFHSVVVIIDRASGLLLGYADGILVGSVDISALGAITSAAAFKIGAGDPAGVHTANMLDGRIDQVVFLLGRAWTAADVLEYHAAEAGSPPGAWNPSEARIRVGTDAAGWLSSDGRSYGAQHGASLARTSGRVRTATFDFVAHIAAPSLQLALLGTGAAGVVFDAVTVRRIWRWHFARPRLLAGAMPSSSVGQQDTFFGAEVIGQGEVGLANGDGLVEEMLAGFEWISAEARVHQGGVMPDGRELSFCAYLRRFTGRVEEPEDVTDQTVSLPLEDSKGLLHRDAPPNSYALADFPAMVAAKVGQPRPLWIGPKTNVSPVRILRDPDTGYGTYELADPTAGVPGRGIGFETAVYAYADQAAATDQVAARRLTLSLGVDYQRDLAACRIEVLRDVQVIEVTAEENLLDFDVGASALLATLTPGLYVPATLAVEAAARLNAAASVADITVTYDDESHRLTVAKGAGTLNLLCDTGVNADLSGWSVLGFDRATDKTTLPSYEGDAEALFDADTDADVLHILRVDGDGYKDDAAGTYTGSASAVITRGVDICRFVWHRLMRQPLDRFDEVAAAAARASHPEPLALYLSTRTTTRTIFEALRSSNLAQIVVDGAGRLYYVPYTDTVPSTAPVLRDRDFASWRAGRPRADVHPEVIVLYGEDPTTGARLERRASDGSVRLAAGRLGRKELDTLHTTGDNAQLLANRAQTLAAARPIVATVTVPSRLARYKPGDFVLVTRARGLGGPFVEEPFRIVWMQHGRLTEARLVQNVEV
jgi:hypothetical protein